MKITPTPLQESSPSIPILPNSGKKSEVENNKFDFHQD